MWNMAPLSVYHRKVFYLSFHSSVLRGMQSRNLPSYLLVFRSLTCRLIVFQLEHSFLMLLQVQLIASFLISLSTFHWNISMLFTYSGQNPDVCWRQLACATDVVRSCALSEQTAKYSNLKRFTTFTWIQAPAAL